MRTRLLMIGFLALTLPGFGQREDTSAHAKAQIALKAKWEKAENWLNTFAFRKYGIDITYGGYFNATNVATTGGVHMFGAFELMFSDRVSWLNRDSSSKVALTWGVGFEPFQGTKLNFGANYDLTSIRGRVLVSAGILYSLGLSQSSSNDGKTYAYVGYHNYLMPCVNAIWWVKKVNYGDPDFARFQAPKFWQLFYVKFQAGYSFLVSPLVVDTTAGFSANAYRIIRNNTSNTIHWNLGVGLSIPSKGYHRDRYSYYLMSKYMWQ